VEQEETAVARQRHSKHVSAATNSDAPIVDAVFSMRSVHENQQKQTNQSELLVSSRYMATTSDDRIKKQETLRVL
jgi:hypothetical protein